MTTIEFGTRYSARLIRSRRIGRHAVERASDGRDVAASAAGRRGSRRETRECLLARPEKDGVGVRRRLVGQRRDVQAAERDEHASRAVVVGERVGAARVGDVDLDDDEVRPIVGVERLDVLVLDRRLVVGRRDRPASVARPSGGNSEYLIGRQYGLVASVSAGRMNLTRSGRMAVPWSLVASR